MGFAKTLLVQILTGAIGFYRRFVSPLLGHNCRFVPNCSAYAQDALREHGLRGVPMAAKRLCRCHPFSVNAYQFDPVKDKA